MFSTCQGPAPYKPLLLLLTLSRLWNGYPRMRLYREIEPELNNLMVRFGPPRSRHAPHQPFQRLVRDELWEIEGLDPIHLDHSGQLRPHLLRLSNVKGGLPEEIWNLLHMEPSLVRTAAKRLLQIFPRSLHDEILVESQVANIGKPLSLSSDQLRPFTYNNDSRFKANVIQAYSERCAICGYGMHIQSVHIGLDVAHIQWQVCGGPNEVTNGLAFCSVHRQAFDSGCLGLTDELLLLLSPKLEMHSNSRDFWFRPFEGMQIRRPTQKRQEPDPHFLEWHRTRIFQGGF